VLRVTVLSGGLVLAESSVKTIRLGPPVVVHSVLRSTTAEPSARVVKSVTGSPSGTQTTVLGLGAGTPRVGGALVLGASSRAPNGLLGAITSVKRLAGGSTEVTTRPGTLEDAYSSFDAQINGDLGQLVEQKATTATVRGHTAASLGLFDVSFNCSDPNVEKTITHSIDMSSMHISANVAIPSYSNGYYGPGVELALYGQPKLNFTVTFTGSQKCAAQAAAKIPIPGTPGLFVEIGPDFTLTGSGSVGVNFTWAPKIFYGFARFRSGPNWDSHEFNNGGNVKFTGAAGLKLSLGLDAGISLAGQFGVRGSLGPEVTGQVSAQSSPPQACLSVNADFAASLTAFANVFFNDYTFNIGSATFGNLQLYRGCILSGASGGGGPGGGGAGPPGGGSPPPPGGGGTGSGGTPGSGAIRRSVAAGRFDSCAIGSGGVVQCWGEDINGQLGAPFYENSIFSAHPLKVSGVTGAAAVSTRGWQSCAVLTTGGVDCWGSVDGSFHSEAVSLTGISDAASVSVGEEASCALLGTGGVDCWGSGRTGELGNGEIYTSSNTPVAVHNISSATSVSAGYHAGCATLVNGTVDCWGSNVAGVLGVPSEELSYSSTPVQVSGVANATEVSVGYEACALLKNGQIECWGRLFSSKPPEIVPGIDNATEISVGESIICALLSTGQVKCWGSNQWGALGDGSSYTTEPYSEIPVLVSGIDNATELESGREHSCARLSTGAVDCWGDNRSGQLGIGTGSSSVNPVTVESVSGAVEVGVSSNYYACARLGSGQVTCWGAENPAVTHSPEENFSYYENVLPTEVSGISTATALSTGGDSACALISVGKVDCWGRNELGQLGDGSTTSSATPVSVKGISNATQVSVGDRTACAILEGGRIDCWGENGYGELGNGTASDEANPEPVEVSGISDATSVSAGQDNTCAALATGAVDCWGADSSDTPTAIPGVSEAVAVAAGEAECALLSSGHVECWNQEKKVLEEVGYLSNAVAIGAGGDHNCALLSTGAVECWGGNDNGDSDNSGDGSSLNYSPNAEPAIITNATSVAAAGFESCAVVPGGTVECWGNDEGAQLGIGNTDFKDAPVAVIGLL
jgi:alpha-tubulin suppressor-like RCC1 family protein